MIAHENKRYNKREEREREGQRERERDRVMVYTTPSSLANCCWTCVRRSERPKRAVKASFRKALLEGRICPLRP